MITEIAGLKINYINSQDLTKKVTEAKEQTDKELSEVKKTYQTLRRREMVLKKFLG